MLNLMDQCDIVEKQHQKRLENRDTHPASDDNTFQFKNNPFSVFSGILPGNLRRFFILTRLCAVCQLCVHGNWRGSIVLASPHHPSNLCTICVACYKAIMCFCVCYSQVQNGAEQVCVVGLIERSIILQLNIGVDWPCNWIVLESSPLDFVPIAGDIATTYSDLGKCHDMARIQFIAIMCFGKKREQRLGNARSQTEK